MQLPKIKKLFATTVLISALVGAFSSKAQINLKPKNVELSVFNNGNFMPGKGALGIWSKTVHPGISIGTRYLYKDKKKHQWLQSINLGYFYHQHAQHGIQLYTELIYRYKISKAFWVEPRLNLGYMLSVADLQQFELVDGTYQKKAWKGRSQQMAGLSANVGYDLSKVTKLPLDIFVGYRFWIQSPFVTGYVPVLPNNSVHFGAIYNFKNNKK